MLSLDVAIPNFGVQEWVVHPKEVADVIHGGPTFADGYLHVSDTPGLGCDIDETAATRYPYRRAYLPCEPSAQEGAGPVEARLYGLFGDVEALRSLGGIHLLLYRLTCPSNRCPYTSDCGVRQSN